ncbi:MAG: HAD-IIB family hydrolase [Eubacterium sp.]|nr:HAD-IIB family hydrolase [Eubacterium sp.]
MEKKYNNALFFDIDGTLVNEEKIFPQSARDAIRLTREKGSIVFINTGRVKCNIEPSILEAGFDGLICGCGSNIVLLGEEEKELLHKRVSKERCYEIALKCREYGMRSLYEYKDYTCIDKENISSQADRIVGYFKSNGYRFIDDIDDPDFLFDKFAGWYYDDSDVEGFKEFISEDFTYIDREGNFFEVEPKGFSKATGIKFILDYFNIPLHNAYVFGDGNNDLEMLRLVPNSIVPKGGSELALEAASYVTDDVMEDGIYKAMKHFGLI